MAPSRVSPDPPPVLGADKLGLSAAQLASWKENGYLVIPDALDSSTVATLLETTHDLLASFPLETHPMTKFSTGDSSTAHVGDDYFLTSGDKIHFFFEEGAFAPGSSTLTKPKHLAINKIGHYLHHLSPPFAAATLTDRNAVYARALGFRDPRVLQSMLICKQPQIGGAVPSHQDSTFLYTDPPSAVGFWYALEDATATNGCLSFARGSHRRAPVRQRFVRRADGAGTEFTEVEGARFPRGEGEAGGNEGQSDERQGVEGAEGEQEQQEVFTMEEVKAGTLVLIHGNLLHKSEANLSPKSRFVYTFHMIEGECEYDERNWLQPPERGFSTLYT